MKAMNVASLQLDLRNPRLGAAGEQRSQRQLIQELFDREKALAVASSIAKRGYFPNEALLAIKEGSQFVVVEGNRRLAALKALRDPALLEGPNRARVAKLSRSIPDLDSIKRVPVVVAPSRRATDAQLAGRHGSTPVEAWSAEAKANFILEKVEEGYSQAALDADLGYSAADLEGARKIRGIVTAIRSLDLPDEIQSKAEARTANFLSTIERVFDSVSGRQFLNVEPSAEHGFTIHSKPEEFKEALSRLVTDLLNKDESSRTLNTKEEMSAYFERWLPRDGLAAAQTPPIGPDSLVPPSAPKSPPQGDQSGERVRRQPPENPWAVPRTFIVDAGSPRLVHMRNELAKLRREAFPNATSMLMRAFFELAVVDYLQRTGELQATVDRLQKAGALRGETPTMRQLVEDITRIAKANLSKDEADQVLKAVKPDRSAPFNVEDLNGFVHNASAIPTGRDVQQFWSRVEPLFKLMLQRTTQ